MLGFIIGLFTGSFISFVVLSACAMASEKAEGGEMYGKDK